ncbi:MAG TPA: NTP transferase domain-containing protein [Stellaceae bacterium]|nr:NTP transferase domain-containing protein [Stellaceae bacterium]
MTRGATGAILQGGIIAAGSGSRLRAEGSRVSKPMVAVAGRPLIEHALDRLRAAGIRRLTIIINEASDDCRRWLEDRAGDLQLDLIVRTTPSSYASFRLVADRLAGARAVITTVDAIMATADFCGFVSQMAALPEDMMVLGVTDLVDDEKPLWVALDPAQGSIRRLGGDRGSHVTAGVYGLPAHRLREPAGGCDRLRDYLGWLLEHGQRMSGILLPRVYDIDRMRDIAAAEQSAAAHGVGRPR